MRTKRRTPDAARGGLRAPFAALAVTLFAVATLACAPRAERDRELAGWRQRAERVEILRDEWGVPHIYAATDADAVFGLMYAQAEDDFHRIEVNYQNALGRRAESIGEAALWSDLRMRLFVDPVELRALYAGSPEWLRRLLDGWADGLNYYLATHPETRPEVLARFEPWMPLAFSEGSIGGDIERVGLAGLEAFYGDPAAQRAGVEPAAKAAERESPRARERIAAVSPASGLAVPDPELEPAGSNGIAIAPARTRDGHALLLINPHTSLFFRHEAHVVSGEGLDVYGALTWGQFFVYQGFNRSAGWMHTSSAVDNIDEFLERVVERDGRLFYRYGAEERPVAVRDVVLRVRTEAGFAERRFTTYRTHHGPVVRAADGRWVSVALMEKPREALAQSFRRTKSRNLATFVETMRGHANSSNNTLFADAEGHVAYLHANFVPVRDPRFDYAHPVDGSDPATDWRGVHAFEESPNSIDPPNGWVVNTNDWPYLAAGAASPRREDYPAYMDRGRDNPRAVHARTLLEGSQGWTLERLRAAAFDPWLPAFEDLVPALVADFDALRAGSAQRRRLAEPVEALRGWDRRWAIDSVPTALACSWGEELLRLLREDPDAKGKDPVGHALRPEARSARLAALESAVARLESDFGAWRTPWGEINRFQRLTAALVPPFDDGAPSIPVGFVSGRWGSLAAFGAAPRNGSKRWYGTSGNTFVAVVELAAPVRALAVTAGGLAADPDSPHFDDQAGRYASGDLRPVHLERAEVERHAERRYRPGL